MKYVETIPDQWFRPTKVWFQRCCDCKLVHKITFDQPVLIKVERDERKTAAGRRKRR